MRPPPRELTCARDPCEGTRALPMLSYTRMRSSSSQECVRCAQRGVGHPAPRALGVCQDHPQAAGLGLGLVCECKGTGMVSPLVCAFLPSSIVRVSICESVAANV